MRCPKCNVLMEQGLLADFQQGGVIQTLWVAGDYELEFNAWDWGVNAPKPETAARIGLSLP